MKKKFIISGVAVFLVVLLCSSALFAFADSSLGVTGVHFDPETYSFVSYFDVSSPTDTFTTDRGGTLKRYITTYNSGDYFIFNNYFNYFYLDTDHVSLYYYDSLPSVGDQFHWDYITVNGTLVSDSYNGHPIYRFKLPSDHPYYVRNYFCIYIPPLFVTVNSFISGFFSTAGDFLEGLISHPVFAICCVAVPVASLIIYFTIGASVGFKGRRSRNSRRRRK